MTDGADGELPVVRDSCEHRTPHSAAAITYTRAILICRGCLAVLINRPVVAAPREPLLDDSLSVG